MRHTHGGTLFSRECLTTACSPALNGWPKGITMCITCWRGCVCGGGGGGGGRGGYIVVNVW